MPRVRALALEDFAGVDGRLTALATSGPVTRRLMTPPGADVIVAPPPRSAVEAPDRFPHSRDAGARAGASGGPRFRVSRRHAVAAGRRRYAERADPVAAARR